MYDTIEGLRAYLAASQLAWLFITVVAYLFGCWVYQRLRQHQLANPMLIALLLIAVALWLSQVEYEDYFAGAQFLHFLLGPVTVLLAVPLYKTLKTVGRSLLPLTVALPVGSLLAALPAIVVALWLGASDSVTRALAAKSVTTPIALGITESLAGLTAITAVVVVFTGVFSTIIAGFVFQIFRVRSPQAQGAALGLTAHGVGVGRAVQISESAAAFAGVAMGFNGLLTSLWAPVLVPWIMMG